VNDADSARASSAGAFRAPPEPPFAVGAATVEDAPALVALFERSDAPCFCQYWTFTGDKNAWLERCAMAPAENARALERELQTNSLVGVVARSQGAALGWMRLSAAARVPKIYDQRLYRGLPCFAGDREAIFTVGCFLVDRAARRRHVARAMLREGIELARGAGARAIEAFPRRGEALADEEQWTGPYELYEALGFTVVNDFGPYPVLRLTL
jgi:GNAT superfamily N-acetyltransferase